RSGGRIAIDPDDRVLQPAHGKMQDDTGNALDWTVADDAVMPGAVRPAPTFALEQPQHIIRMPAGMAHRPSAERRQARYLVAVGIRRRNRTLALGCQCRRHPLVGIEPQNPVAARHAKRDVFLRPVAEPVLMSDRGAMRARDLDGPIGAAAVDDDALVAKRQAVEAVADVPRIVLGDGDCGNSCHRSLPVPPLSTPARPRHSGNCTDMHGPAGAAKIVVDRKRRMLWSSGRSWLTA